MLGQILWSSLDERRSLMLFGVLSKHGERDIAPMTWRVHC